MATALAERLAGGDRPSPDAKQPQVVVIIANFLRFGDPGTSSHLGRTSRIDQRADFVDLSDEPGPGGTAFLRRGGSPLA